MSHKAIHTIQAPQAIGPYSQAIQAGNFLFLSGQIGLDPVEALLVSGGCEKELQQIFNNMKAVLSAANATLDNIVKITVYITNFKDFPVVNDMMKAFLKEPFPARTTIQVAALPKGAVIELDAIAEVTP